MGGGSPFPSQEVPKDEPLPKPAEGPAARNATKSVRTLCELWAESSDWRFLFLHLCSVLSNGIVAARSFSLVDKKSALLNFCIYLPFLYLPLSLCFVIHGSNLSATFFCCWVFGRLCMYVAEFPSLLHIPGWPRVTSDAYSDKEFLDANLLACMICEHVQVSNPFVKYMCGSVGYVRGFPIGLTQSPRFAVILGACPLDRWKKDGLPKDYGHDAEHPKQLHQAQEMTW